MESRAFERATDADYGIRPTRMSFVRHFGLRGPVRLDLIGIWTRAARAVLLRNPACKTRSGWEGAKLVVPRGKDSRCATLGPYLSIAFARASPICGQSVLILATLRHDPGKQSGQMSARATGRNRVPDPALVSASVRILQGPLRLNSENPEQQR